MSKSIPLTGTGYDKQVAELEATQTDALRRSRSSLFLARVFAAEAGYVLGTGIEVGPNNKLAYLIPASILSGLAVLFNAQRQYYDNLSQGVTHDTRQQG
jgi:hypothetical protein